MTRKIYDDRDLWAVRDRLKARYPIDTPASQLEQLARALSEHASHAERGDDGYATKLSTGEIRIEVVDWTIPEPTLADLLDGLSLIDDERRRGERRERDLIDAAVAAGATWQQIGIALGHTDASAGRSAKLRRADLKRRLGS